MKRLALEGRAGGAFAPTRRARSACRFSGVAPTTHTVGVRGLPHRDGRATSHQPAGAEVGLDLQEGDVVRAPLDERDQLVIDVLVVAHGRVDAERVLDAVLAEEPTVEADVGEGRR